MRGQKYIIGFILAVVMSCSDFTNIQPDHSLTPNNAFKTIGDIELHLNGIYSGFQSTGYFALAYGTLPDMMSDNLAENVESLGNYRTVVDWLYVANDQTISTIWATPYTLINDCNILLSNVDKFKESKAGQANRLKAQALAIRALAHFDLLRYFGASYDRSSTELGIPIKTVSSLDRPVRNTVKEVYDQIYNDLTQAKALVTSIDVAINSPTDKSRIDAVGIDAIFARVAYYAGDYSQAITSATNAIATGPALASRTDFPAVWADDAVVNEVIWSIAFLPGDGYVAGDVFFAVNNRVSFKPSQALLNTYSQTSYSPNPLNDIRYTSYFSSTTSLRPGELIVSKYLGRGGAVDGLVNWKAFRISEMYLIRAEARARTGQATAARADLKTLRDVRISVPDSEDLSDPSKLLAAILLERRRELFLEGHRWFDLRMQGTGIIRGGDCKAPATVCSLAPGSFRFVWPIPQNEIKANANIAGQQNAGY
jgi:hypothetical protein